MAVNAYNLKKWYHMLNHTSIMHVNQNVGECFIPGEISGYFNNLTEKVTKDPETIKENRLPIVHDQCGDILFPVAIFQYGLGAYDLFLQTKQEIYLRQFYRCVEWACLNQLETGAWDNFSFIYPDNPFGAMCQGEAASLLIRAYKHSGNQEYLDAAKNAIDFMLCPVEKGGTTQYLNNDVIFLEYTHLAPVLNGWVFALFGLYDLNIVLPRESDEEIISQAVNSLIHYLPKFDNGFWSRYDLDNRIASPFYHKLHIAQLEALFLSFDDPVFWEYKERFESYQKNPFYKTVAFVEKAYQKIKE